MIIRVKKCQSCGTVTACRHTGAWWLCPSCWALRFPDTPEDAA